MPLNVLAPIEPILFLTAILILFLIGFDKHSPTASHSLVMTSNTLFGVLYIAWFGSFMLKMRLIPETGAWWIFYVVFTVKMGDAGAYFVGKNFGRTKLLPHISPNKSVEGALACSAVVLVSSILAKVYLPGVPLLHLFFLGLALGVLAQIGDLVESLIKRNLNAKDSGFIPGLGGMLDIMDSLLFSFPFVYFYVQAVPGMLPQ
jgi:phosphatidate cytidylyltransferase